MFGFNLQAVPLTIIGVSYSVAAFPTLARFHAAGNKEEFVKHIEGALRHILFWSVPATALIIVLRAQIVRVILGSGAFDWDATRLTAAALALFVLSLVAQSIIMLVARAYYAAGKTKTPLYLGALFVVVSILSSVLLLYGFLHSSLWRYFLESILRVSDIVGTSVLMLALGYTIGAITQAAVGLIVFSKDFGISYQRLWRLTFQSFSAGILGGAVSYGALSIMGLLVDINTVAGILSQGVVGGILGLVGVVAVLLILKNPELAEVYYSLRKHLKDTPPVALEPTDVSS
jgi:peptidoglycan biosynthesis protein MviN/MurJ (putative lipid II flippase)